jgi:broad specificity phosphatase PhoE
VCCHERARAVAGETRGERRQRGSRRCRRSGAELIDVPSRDADVALSDTGVEQAEALGVGLGNLPADRRPDAVWCSTYRRAQETAQVAMQAARLNAPLRLDERLRDRELGVLDMLTVQGVEARFPRSGPPALAGQVLPPPSRW